MENNHQQKTSGAFSKIKIGNILMDFCQSTSLHGYSYLYGNSNLALKFVWLFVILAMTSLGIFFIVLNTKQFLEARIDTTIETSSAPISVIIVTSQRSCFDSMH